MMRIAIPEMRVEMILLEDVRCVSELALHLSMLLLIFAGVFSLHVLVSNNTNFSFSSGSLSLEAIFVAGYQPEGLSFLYPSGNIARRFLKLL